MDGRQGDTELGQLDNIGVIEMYWHDRYKTKARREKQERRERQDRISTQFYDEPAWLNSEDEGGECGRAMAGVRERSYSPCRVRLVRSVLNVELP